jgi:hypothetical protein
VNGAATLTGVVYAIPLGEGDRPPPSPFDAAHWHDHAGTVDEESMLLDHDARHAAAGGMRLAVLHLWIWVDNPAGRAVTDNWALPFARLGLETPAGAPIGAARALSLLSDAAPYYLSLARTVAAPDAQEGQRIEAALERATERMHAWWSGRSPAVMVTPAELAMLDSSWTSTWREIESAVAPDVARRLRPVWRP